MGDISAPELETRSLSREEIDTEAVRIKEGIEEVIKDLPEFQGPAIRWLFLNDPKYESYATQAWAMPHFERNGWHWRIAKASEGGEKLTIERSRSPWEDWLKTNPDQEEYVVATKDSWATETRGRPSVLTARRPDLHHPRDPQFGVSNDSRALEALNKMLSDLQGSSAPATPSQAA